jgi:hypothetical protein
VPGIDADMREFGEEGIKRGERELQAANADKIDTLLTNAEIARRLAGPRNGVASAVAFVEGRAGLVWDTAARKG